MTQKTIQTHLVPVPLRWMAKHHRGIPYSPGGCVDLRWTWMHQLSHLLHYFFGSFCCKNLAQESFVFSQYISYPPENYSTSWKLMPWEMIHFLSKMMAFLRTMSLCELLGAKNESESKSIRSLAATPKWWWFLRGPWWWITTVTTWKKALRRKKQTGLFFG